MTFVAIDTNTRRVVLLSLIGQIIPAGLANPIFFFLLEKHASRQPGARTRLSPPDSDVALAVIPSVALAYLVPHLAGFLDPDLGARQWWNWVWQLFGVWSAGLLLVFWFVFARLLPLVKNTKALAGTLKTTRLAAVFFCLVNTGVYWYVHASSGFSWPDVVIPRQLLPPAPSAEEALGTILQYDAICVFGGAFTWLCYQMTALKATGALRVSWGALLSIGVVLGCFVSPGTLWVVGCMVREETLFVNAATTRPAIKKQK